MEGKLEAHKKTIQHSIPIDILDDLSSRFIINVPEEERTNLVRICFQIELAHWFYLDFYCTDDTYNVHPCGMLEFAAHIFQHIPFLQKHRKNLTNVLDNWREYKQSVPTYGAILLDSNLSHVLLVQSFWTKASWGFPKGKVNEDEDPSHCAVREVLEETGFDIGKFIDPNEYIESTIHDQLIRLYICAGIPKDTKFQPRTRNEIKACEWFSLADLPSNKKDMTPKVKMGVSPNAFFMVLPFVKRMRKWVAERSSKSSKRMRHKSMGDIEGSSTKSKTKVISQGLQNEIQEFQLGHSPALNQNIVNSNAHAKNTPKNKKHSKRQLFTAQNNQNGSSNNQSSNGNVQSGKDIIRSTSDPGNSDEISKYTTFVAPSWKNFKFDRRAILDCLIDFNSNLNIT